jgi:hypothetical protein
VAAVFGVLAVRQAAAESAYHHARPCLAGAAAGADCLQPVDGAVTAVAEFPGGGRVSPDYALDVQAASQSLHLTFTSDSPMLRYAVDGDPAIVTMWRGVPVSVLTDGRTEATAAVPDTAFAKKLGECEEAGAIGVFLVLGAAAMRRNQRVGPQLVTRPVLAAAVLALLLGSMVVMIGGIALGGKPSRLGPDLVVTGAALVVVAGLSAWLGISVRHRTRGHEAEMAVASRHVDQARIHHSQSPPTAPPTPRTRSAAPMRARLRPATWAQALRAGAAGWAGTLLTVAVLFGIFFTAMDGPPTRAFRHAHACAGETNLATCAGDFTAVVNGVRTPANGGSYADVSYVTADGVINNWAQFDGDATALARMAEADESSRAPLQIKVWRRSIVGAELGGTWRWADGNPPGDTVPAVFLAVSFALLLLTVRIRVHRRGGGLHADRRRIIIGDGGPAAAAAGAIALLAYGYWPGAILALAALIWLGLSARRTRLAHSDAQLSSLRPF